MAERRDLYNFNSVDVLNLLALLVALVDTSLLSRRLYSLVVLAMARCYASLFFIWTAAGPRLFFVLTLACSSWLLPLYIIIIIVVVLPPFMS